MVQVAVSLLPAVSVALIVNVYVPLDTEAV
jgi:hypothetical protein